MTDTDNLRDLTAEDHEWIEVRADQLFRDSERQRGGVRHATIMPQDFRDYFVARAAWERARAALAAAPQPAPVDREALVEVIEQARWDNGPSSSEFIADALIAHGLRLPSGEAKPRRCAECDCEGGEYECTWIKPGPDRDNALQQLADLGQQADRASETMAWAVVGEDGEVIPGSIYPTRDEAERVCDYEGERVVPVTIRVVEDEDDAA